MDPSPEHTANKLTSERYDAFIEALDVLYIKNNISGRNQFAAAWPAAAGYIFGEELQHHDREGSGDRERRMALETEADDRRLELLKIAETLEQKSIFEGALRLDYVQPLIEQLGRPLALHLYGRWLVDRFIPPGPEEIAAEPVAAAPEPVQIAEKPAPVYEDRFDKIRPISVEQDYSPPVEEEEEPESLFPQGAFENKNPEEPGLIKGTEGEGETLNLPEAAQESLAPVVGGTKKPGLKILSISETDESDKN